MASSKLAHARSSDEALMASGFYQAVNFLASAVQEELDKIALETKRNKERWNARTGTDA